MAKIRVTFRWIFIKRRLSNVDTMRTSLQQGTHEGCEFSDDIKLPKSSEFEGVSVFNLRMTLVDVQPLQFTQIV